MKFIAFGMRRSSSVTLSRSQVAIFDHYDWLSGPREAIFRPKMLAHNKQTVRMLFVPFLRISFPLFFLSFFFFFIPFYPLFIPCSFAIISVDHAALTMARCSSCSFNLSRFRRVVDRHILSAASFPRLIIYILQIPRERVRDTVRLRVIDARGRETDAHEDAWRKRQEHYERRLAGKRDQNERNKDRVGRAEVRANA